MNSNHNPLKPRENGRNIVRQQLQTSLDVTCCVRLRTLLHVVPPTTLGIVRRQCCVRLHGAKNLTGFKLCATTCNKPCSRTQHVTPNKGGSCCWSKMIRPFAPREKYRCKYGNISCFYSSFHLKSNFCFFFLWKILAC